MNPIILYYSRSGHTQKLAQRISEDLNCNLLKIEPEEAYGNYVASCLRVIKEKSNDVPPKFITAIPDLTSYDVVMLGFPIWAQNPPVFVSEFIAQCDLREKTVVPFATFGMTGVNWTMKTLERVCTGAEIKMPFNYGMVKKDHYDKWIHSVRGIK